MTGTLTGLTSGKIGPAFEHRLDVAVSEVEAVAISEDGRRYLSSLEQRLLNTCLGLWQELDRQADRHSYRARPAVTVHSAR